MAYNSEHLSPMSLVTGCSAALQSACEEAMEHCESDCFRDTRTCTGCSGEPIATRPDEGRTVRYEECCDASGCCGLFPRCCRNPFWPEFAKPTWLCCKDLYRQ